MPDLDQIKQAEQGARDRHGRFARGRSGNPPGRPRGCRDHVNRAARLLLAGEGEARARAGGGRWRARLIPASIGSRRGERLRLRKKARRRSAAVVYGAPRRRWAPSSATRWRAPALIWQRSPAFVAPTKPPPPSP